MDVIKNYQPEVIRFQLPDKIEFVRCHINLSDTELAEYFNTSAGSIKAMRMRYGISRFDRRPFTSKEDEIIRKLYPDTLTSDIAIKLNRSERSVYNHAHLLGLKKSKEFIRSIGFQPGSEIGKAYRFPKGHIPANKGKKMAPGIKERIKHTFFQKGHKPHNTKYDGAISIRRDKRTGIAYKYIRLSEGHWEELHRHIWEKQHGAIPKGYNVVFKDGDTMNCSIENLELISNAELMRRNTIHRYPPEVKQSIRLLGKLERTIKKINHGTK